VRVKAVIAYDGSSFFGFQKQNTTDQTITGHLEHALHTLKIDSPIVASGRTDAGVHATGQVIHFDLPPYWNDLEKLKLNLNRKLQEIHVKHITKVADDFHARFSAKRRLYRYVFKTQQPSVFEQKYIAYYDPFDSTLLQQALQSFVGTHDFRYFHKTGSEPHTTIRNVYRAYYRKEGKYHFIYFEANGFLRSQVRMMIESAMQCAKKEMTITELKGQLAGEKRYNHRLAPPQGLYLARIFY
jgi:tRNA pseudouridine38-40 synthase